MHTSLTIFARRFIAAALPGMLAAVAFFDAHAQEMEAKTVEELPPITIHRTKNPGDVRYGDFLQGWNLLQSYLPSEPRVLDVRMRLSFTNLSEPARDDYLPDTWAVAIVGDTLDHAIEVARGGYFVLPQLEQAVKEKATIMFNAQTRKDYLNVAWKFRIADGQTLSYADFARAFDEVTSVQKKIPLWRTSLRDERLARFDGLKACFHPEQGRIEIDGKPAETTSSGLCQVLKFDPAMTRMEAGTRGGSIAFIGPLNIVTLHETSR